MGYKVAVVGATGAVGREMLKTLAERDFPVDDVVALASPRSAGQQVSFGEKRVLTVRNTESFDFAGWDLGLFSPGAAISAVHAPRAAAAGCIVIDNTSQFRMEPDVPLVVPEVNPQALARHTRRRIIANPNCSTIQLVMALKPLHDRFTARRVVVSTYQSVSGAGKEGMDELFTSSKAFFVNDPAQPQVFTKTIAYNCIPHIDRFLDDGATKEEWKMAVETPQDLGPRHRRVRHLRARAGVHRPRRGGGGRVRGAGQSGRGARPSARLSGRGRGRSPRTTDGFVTPAEVAGRGQRSIVSRHPAKTRTVENGLGFLVRSRTTCAQGRGAERGADRRNAGGTGPAAPAGGLTETEVWGPDPSRGVWGTSFPDFLDSIKTHELDQKAAQASTLTTPTDFW